MRDTVVDHALGLDLDLVRLNGCARDDLAVLQELLHQGFLFDSSDSSRIRRALGCQFEVQPMKCGSFSSSSLHQISPLFPHDGLALALHHLVEIRSFSDVPSVERGFVLNTLPQTYVATDERS